MEGFNPLRPGTPEGKRQRAIEEERMLADFEERARIEYEKQVEKLERLEEEAKADPRRQLDADEQRKIVALYPEANEAEAAAVRENIEMLRAEADEEQREAA
ncbi:MAG TPA: hypothetical protein VFY28_00395 [Candidatus Paceibacterota bacterium]|nr:hypothetical protein [Candidatus Paceibacterota bacterium]